MVKLEDLSNRRLERIRQAHLAMTRSALIQIFEKTETDADEAIKELEARYVRYSPRMRDLLLHNGPVSLACELANCKWTDVQQDRLQKFNETCRATLEQSLEAW